MKVVLHTFLLLEEESFFESKQWYTSFRKDILVTATKTKYSNLHMSIIRTRNP